MRPLDDKMRKFSNHRQWRDFVAAIHVSVTRPLVVTYPMVLSALRASGAWFSDRAVCRHAPKACGCAVRT